MENNTPDHDKKNMNQDTPETAAPMDFEYIIKNNMIENTLLSLANQQGIDIFSCALNPWKALLMECGALLFPGNELKIFINIHDNNYNNISCKNYVYDFNKLNTVCNIYIHLSYKYNKIINVLYYGLLCNIKNNSIYTILSTNHNYNNNEVCKDFNNLSISIYKRLKGEREENLKEKCFESPGAVGTIAIGNVENGWNLTPGQKAITQDNNNILSLGQLPTLKAIGTAENPQNADILSD